ncbi:MAG: enoyl-CoA hydratase, partial [Candidatus Sericytochromatia bacterium]|nr:enoyl-CoA hydratase [Candidatus Sericytochromatia bacterium]
MRESTASGQAVGLITRERCGPVLLLGLNRPEKRNAFTLAMIRELSAGIAELE